MLKLAAVCLTLALGPTAAGTLSIPNVHFFIVPASLNLIDKSTSAVAWVVRTTRFASS